MTEDLAARVTPAQSKYLLWVDWSGISAVAVCSCGWQAWGGFSAREGRWAVMGHRAAEHPEWAADTYIHIEGPPCAWGNTVWGSMLGESCDAAPRTNGLCKTHATRVHKFEHLGMCSLDGCHVPCAEGQDVCRTHLTRWARDNRLDLGKVRAGDIKWPDLPRPQGGRPKATFEGERPIVYAQQHGTRTGYKRGCRCAPCSLAQSAYASEARIKRLAKQGGGAV